MNELARPGWAEQPLRRRLTALVFLDVVGYARLVATNEDATLRAWLTLRHSVIEPQIAAWRGRIIDCAGDGIFGEFTSALEALHWAMEVQDAAGGYRFPDAPISLRIAVHLADVVEGPEGAVQGDGVNTTSRLQTYADAGGIIVSQAVADTVQGKTDATFIDLGLLKLKNIAYPVRAFRLGPPQGSRSPVRQWKRLYLVMVSTAVAIVFMLSAVVGWHVIQHYRAERLLAQGLAITCPIQPCAREWLAQRELFQQAINADPTLARPYAEAALTHTNFVFANLSNDIQEDMRIATNLATKAVALAPHQAYAQYAYGSALRADPSRLEDALATYLRVLSIEPNHILARANVGWVLILLGRPAEGEPYVQAALDAAPRHVLAPYWLDRIGLAELFLDRDGHGASFFRRAIAQQSDAEASIPSTLEFRVNLAAAMALNGEVDAARRLIRRLRSERPLLSVNDIWHCPCYPQTRSQPGVMKLLKGAALAGLFGAD
jgi:class 3 adenylate cyclase